MNKQVKSERTYATNFVRAQKPENLTYHFLSPNMKLVKRIGKKIQKDITDDPVHKILPIYILQGHDLILKGACCGNNDWNDEDKKYKFN